MKVRLGLLSQINAAPLKYGIEKTAKKLDDIKFELFYGAPQELNHMFNEDELDISIISSIEFLKNKNKYTLLRYTISCDGPVKSVILLSETEPETLENSPVNITSVSATGATLLKMVFRFYFKCKPVYNLVDDKKIEMENIDSFIPLLLIGDKALKYYCKIESQKQKILIFDLGELWKKLSSYGMVYAVMCVKNNIYTPNIIERLNGIVEEANIIGLNNMDNYLPEISVKTGIKMEILKEYLLRFSYTLGASEKHWLDVFESGYMKHEKGLFSEFEMRKS